MADEKQLPLHAIPNLQFEKIHQDAINTLAEHLSKTKVPDDMKKWKKHVNATLELLKQQQQQRMEAQVEFMRTMIEVTKERDINHFLQTVPYPTGKQKEKEAILQEEKKRRRKRRKK
jgi:hypothetical protein